MKSVLLTLGVFAVSSFAHAAPSTSSAQVQRVEAAAVLKSAEIAAHLNLEKKLHHLTCGKEKLADVKISEDGAMDSFEMVYSCRASADDASFQRIHFSGGVYTAAPDSKTADVILMDMSIELVN